MTTRLSAGTARLMRNIAGLCLLLLFTVLLAGCSSEEDRYADMEVNKTMFDFGPQGGKELLYGLKQTSLLLREVELVDRKTNKRLGNWVLTSKPTELTSGDKVYATVDYNLTNDPTRITFDWCEIKLQGLSLIGLINSYSIEVKSPNAQTYILRLGIYGHPKVWRGITIQ